jgi:hypothetical protein
MKKKFQAHNAHKNFFSSPFIHVLKLNASFNLAIFAVAAAAVAPRRFH